MAQDNDWCRITVRTGAAEVEPPEEITDWPGGEEPLPPIDDDDEQDGGDRGECEHCGWEIELGGDVWRAAGSPGCGSNRGGHSPVRNEDGSPAGAS